MAPLLPYSVDWDGHSPLTRPERKGHRLHTSLEGTSVTLYEEHVPWKKYIGVAVFVECHQLHSLSLLLLP